MVKVIVTGAGGRMGTRLVSLIKETPNLQLVGAVERKGHPAVGADAGETAGCGRLGVAVTDNLAALADRAQVLVEFTSPDATLMHLAIMAASRKAMVIGTTGFSAEQLAGLRELAKGIPCVFAPNMSVGVNVLLKMLPQIARTLGEDYDIEVLEAHHRLKKDAPSGTALKMAQVLAEAMGKALDAVAAYGRKGMIGERKRGEIGSSSRRLSWPCAMSTCPASPVSASCVTSSPSTRTPRRSWSPAWMTLGSPTSPWSKARTAMSSSRSSPMRF